LSFQNKSNFYLFNYKSISVFLLKNFYLTLFIHFLKLTIMKKIGIMLFAATIIATSAFIAGKNFMSGINGTVTPADGAGKVWAISGKDSVVAVPAAGKFSLEVKPGSWKVYVQAVKGYKDAAVENIVVENDRYTDAGEIKLTPDK
jgi:hypothetical protein